MEVTLSGMVMPDKRLQRPKAAFSMMVTLSGMSTLVRLAQLANEENRMVAGFVAAF